jgi:hypothetical protein
MAPFRSTSPRPTQPFNPGTDTLQVVTGTSKDVFWSGQILVAANPFMSELAVGPGLYSQT